MDVPAPAPPAVLDPPAAPPPDPVLPVAARSPECLGVAQVLARVGDKWTVLVILLLRDRDRRFNELRRGIQGISQRMLTLTLRHLERDGLVTRTVTPSIPPRVDYALTALGHSLAGPVQALGGWAFAHLAAIEAARARYDAARAAGE